MGDESVAPSAKEVEISCPALAGTQKNEVRTEITNCAAILSLLVRSNFDTKVSLLS